MMVWTGQKHFILFLASEDDCVALQQDLDKVYCWAEEIGMVFNAGEFELLRFWLDRETAPDTLYGP